MECDFAFLCDHAVQDRKLHALGIGWDTLYAANVPVSHPSMCLVAKLKGSIAENGTKDISLHVIDADGEHVIPPIERQMPFEIKPPRITGHMQLVMVLAGLKFRKYGSYDIRLVVQGNEMKTVTFNVVEPPTTS